MLIPYFKFCKKNSWELFSQLEGNRNTFRDSSFNIFHFVSLLSGRQFAKEKISPLFSLRRASSSMEANKKLFLFNPSALRRAKLYHMEQPQSKVWSDNFVSLCRFILVYFSTLVQSERPNLYAVEPVKRFEFRVREVSFQRRKKPRLSKTVTQFFTLRYGEA